MLKIAALIATVAVMSHAQQIYYLPMPQQQQQQQAAQPAPQPAAQPAPQQAYQPMFESPLYAYIPPSPLVPSCPTGYTCCGNFKYYDPQGTKRCCGDRTYTPALQSCANGMVVTIVQAAQAAQTTPLPVYVQRVELVCEGVKWQVPYPNYACCGPSVFNVAREVCGVGLDAAPTTTTAAPTTTTTTTTAAPTTAAATTTATTGRILTCQGRRYAVPGVDYQFYACCGYEAFFWPTERCVNGTVSPTKPPTTTTNATPSDVSMILLCNTIAYWISPADRQYFGCCGSNMYDTRTDRCTNPQ